MHEAGLCRLSLTQVKKATSGELAACGGSPLIVGHERHLPPSARKIAECVSRVVESCRDQDCFCVSAQQGSCPPKKADQGCRHNDRSDETRNHGKAITLDHAPCEERQTERRRYIEERYRQEQQDRQIEAHKSEALIAPCQPLPARMCMSLGPSENMRHAGAQEAQKPCWKDTVTDAARQAGLLAKPGQMRRDDDQGHSKDR